MKRNTGFAALAAIAGLVLAAAPADADIIVNGDFETGNFSGWTSAVGGHSIDSATPLSGSHSALLVPVLNAQIYQSFTPITEKAITTFIFKISDPGGPTDRSLNVNWQGSTGTAQINLRVVDLDSDGDGDVQVFNGSWQTVLNSAVTFDDTTSLSLTLNSYGAGSSYDLNVGGNLATGLTYFQNAPLSDFGRLSFVNSSLATGSTFRFDDVSVMVIPEPSTLALVGLCGLTLLCVRGSFRK